VRLAWPDSPSAIAAALATLVGLACSAPPAAELPASSAGAGGTGAGSPSTGGAGSGGAGVSTGGNAAGATGGSAVQAGAPGSVSGGAAGGAGDGGSGSSGPPGVPLDPALLAHCTGTSPIVCQLDAPDGNYDVTVDLGADDATASSRAEAETRHAFAAEQPTLAGEHALLTMTVNVRAEKHDGDQSAPGNMLDLTIAGDAPRLRGLGFRSAPAAVTVFVAGDSTVCDWLGTNTSAVNDDEMGWAQALAQYFAPGVAIANYADSGETAGPFHDKFFLPAAAAMKAGDYVFIQFGHNDQKEVATRDAYKASVMRYVDEARAKQAVPVLFTPVARKDNVNFEGIDAQARELAAEEGIALFDLTMLSAAHYATVPDKNALFVDGTHLSSRGATEVAALVASAVKSSQLPLRSHVR
jgi:lysophospholipase L1-like esterase